MRKSRSPFIFFYILAGYILLQLTWWAYLLIELNKEYYSLKEQISPDLDKSILSKKVMMIVGEGSVFLLFLLIGIYTLKKFLRKELTFAQQQQNFLLSVSHELRSPIASIKLHLQTIKLRELERTTQNQMIDKSIDDTERLNNLIDKILLANLIDNKSKQFDLHRIDISKITTDTIGKLRDTIGKNHETKIEASPDIYLKTDETLFTSILINIYENAVKYSKENSTISVSLYENKMNIVLKVGDEGIGIAEAESKNIFRKFYRIGNEITRNTKGTGLGLFIVKNIVEMHKGSIVSYPNNEMGTVFEVWFKK
jgi:two-component system, OmpR family, phosphate regulon sensor histidine kinase PhoR